MNTTDELKTRAAEAYGHAVTVKPWPGRPGSFEVWAGFFDGCVGWGDSEASALKAAIAHAPDGMRHTLKELAACERSTASVLASLREHAPILHDPPADQTTPKGFLDTCPTCTRDGKPTGRDLRPLAQAVLDTVPKPGESEPADWGTSCGVTLRIEALADGGGRAGLALATWLRSLDSAGPDPAPGLAEALTQVWESLTVECPECEDKDGRRGEVPVRYVNNDPVGRKPCPVCAGSGRVPRAQP